MNGKKWISFTLMLAVVLSTAAQAQPAVPGWDGQTGMVDESTGERLPEATVELVQDGDDPYHWTLAAGRIAYLNEGWLPGLDYPVGRGYRIAFRIPMPEYAEFDVELVAECMSGMTYEGMLGEEYGFGMVADEKQYLVFYPCVSFGDGAFADQREIRIWVQWSMDSYEEYTITVSDQVELLPKDATGMITTTASTTTTAIFSSVPGTRTQKTTAQGAASAVTKDTTESTTVGVTAETTGHSTDSTTISSTTTAATTAASTQLPEVTVSTAKTEETTAKTTAQTKKTTTVEQTEQKTDALPAGGRDIVDLLSSHAPIVQVAYTPRLAAAAYREGAVEAADPVNGVELNVYPTAVEERTAFAQDNGLSQVPACWDVSLVERNGAKMTLNEQAVIALPLDETLYTLLQNDRTAYRLYHQEEDGTLSVLPFAVIRTPSREGYLLFWTSSFSPFALGKPEQIKMDNPKTGDQRSIGLWALVGCLSLCGGMLCKRRCVN